MLVEFCSAMILAKPTTISSPATCRGTTLSIAESSWRRTHRARAQKLNTWASFTTRLPITSRSITGFRFQERVRGLAFLPTVLRTRTRFWQHRHPQSNPETMGSPAWLSTAMLRAIRFADNMIVANQISGNRADLFDTATPGPTGINVNSGFWFLAHCR